MEKNVKPTKEIEMSKHTKEPWKYDDGDIFGNDVEAVSMTGHDGFSPNEANSRRIIACVNALPGVENPEQAVRQLVEAARPFARHLDDRDECHYCRIGKPQPECLLYTALLPFKDIA